jgi:CHAT domain-containing protein
MKYSCSLRLDLIQQNDQFGWRTFHRTAGSNSSTAPVLAMPESRIPAKITESLQTALRLHDIVMLKEWGKKTAQGLFPTEIKSNLEKFTSGDLLFMVPEEWADVPFELLYIADDFLCRRFAIGTILCTNQEHGTLAKYNTASSILIIAGLSGDIPAAYYEAEEVHKCAREADKDAHFISTSDKQKIADAMGTASIIHFAGHSVYTGEKHNSGWKFGSTDLFDITAMEQLGNNDRVPWLVFSNSCNAGNSGCDKELSGIAGAFLRSGVMQVIGPAAEIPDKEAHRFAICFYEYLFKGMTCGEALFIARQRLHQENQAMISPLLYRLYGDPCFAAQSSNRVAGKNEPKKPFVKSKKFIIMLLALLAILIIILLIVPFGNGNIIYVPAR